MNVRLQLDLDFMAGVYHENQLYHNQYNVSLSLLTQTTDAAATNVAVDRIKAFIYSELANTVFFGPENPELVVDTDKYSVVECTDIVIKKLEELGILNK